MKPALAAGAALFGLLLSACSDGGEPVSDAPNADPPPAPVPAAPPSGPGQPALGGGQALNGAISVLTGMITGFAVRETRTQTIVELATDVLFAFDSAELTPDASEALARTAQMIKAGGPGEIVIVGHTDALGDAAYNQRLSLRRASAVAEWMSSTGGVDPARLRPEGRGETEPVAPNAGSAGQDDPAGRAKNRRVVVTIPK